MDLRRFFTNQPWWGKLLGAFLGYLMAGPAGALFGILIGNFFDRGLVESVNNPLLPYHHEMRQTVKTLFIETTFATMGHLAKANGRVSEQDIQLAKTLMQDMRLNPTQRADAKHFFNEGKKPLFNVKHAFTLLQKATRDNPPLLKLFIDIAYNAAKQGGLSDKKIRIMNTLLSGMRYDPLHKQSRFYEEAYYRTNQQSSHQHTHHEPSPSYSQLDSAYAVLQIPVTSNKIEVKRAYRRLISRNHPDKLMAQNKSLDEIKRANEKTQVIRKAYEQICTSKGW